jgi:hypothetical protein
MLKAEIPRSALGFLLGAALTCVLLLAGCSGGRKVILGELKYDTLAAKEIPAGGIGLDLLVDPSAKKEQVLKLARDLREANRAAGIVQIEIFDAREAWENRGNLSYPRDKFRQHLLVGVAVNPEAHVDTVLWFGQGRAE